MSHRKELTGLRFGRWVVKGLKESKNGVLYWNVKCDCGTEKYVSGGSLKQGQSKGCSKCVKREKRTADGDSAKWSLFTSNKINAARRGIVFTLSLEEFLRITGSSCHYCGIKWSSDYPKTIYADNFKKKNLIGKMKLNGTYKHNGIDRVDSNIGYVSDNCVPCCKDCNFAKQQMSREQFREWIVRAYKHLFGEEKSTIKTEGINV